MKLQIYRTVILPFVVCGCETWSVTFREERRLMVMENKVQREILGPERKEVTRGWIKWHNEGLHDSCLLLNVIRAIK
jgi:uncharacterized protein YbdZ (MbtH family)